MLRLESPGIVDGKIADRYGRYSEDQVDGIPQISIPLRWEGAPEGTMSFAVSMWDFDDIEDEGFPFLHWVVADIPAGTNRLEEDASRKEPKLIQGKNGWIVDHGEDRENVLCNRYGGPAAMSGQHEYEIRLYALSEMLGLENGFYYNQFVREARGKILEEISIYGVYG